MIICLKTPCLWNGISEIRVDRYPFIVGRHRDTDYALPLAFVSRQHCRFTLQDQTVFIQDLESHNGTFVNGARALRPTPIRHGDEVSLGPLSFRVSSEGTGGDTTADCASRRTREIHEPFNDSPTLADGGNGAYQTHV